MSKVSLKDVFEGKAFDIIGTIPFSVKFLLIEGGETEDGESYAGLVESCIKYVDGSAVEDWYSKKILLANTLINNYTNIDTEEDVDFDLMIEYDFVEKITRTSRDAFGFVEIFEKSLKDTIDAKNNIGSVFARAIKPSVDALIKKIPEAKEIEKITKSLPNVVKKTLANITDDNKSFLVELMGGKRNGEVKNTGV